MENTQNNKEKRTFSISFVIIAILVTFSLAGTASLLFLSKKYSESALHALADEIVLRTVNDSAEHIRILMKPALNAVSIVESQIHDDVEISDDAQYNEAMIVSMIKSLEDLKNVYSVYYANENGEFFLIGKRQKFENDLRKYYFHKKIQIKNGVRKTTESWYGEFGDVAPTELPEDTYDPRTRPWYRKAHNEMGPVWSSPYIFYITKFPGITYAKPVYKDGVFKGVIAADLEINTISDFLLDGIFTKHTSIFALDTQDEILAHTDFSTKYNNISKLKDAIPKSEDFDDPVLQALKAKVEIDHSYGEVTDIDTPKGLYKAILKPFSLNGLELIVGLYTPASDYLHPFYVKYRILIIISLIMLLFVIVISRYVSVGLAKPFKELSSATENAKELKFDKKINIHTCFREVSSTQNNFNDMLESLKNYQLANEVLSDTLHNAHIDTLYRLAMAAEHKDQYTYDHLKRVSNISVMIADVIGMSKHDIEQIRHASAMHDVGKLGIPDSILMKPGKLTEDEFNVIKTHSNLGAKILDRPSSEEMHSARIIAKSHHEKWDGSGYPDNLAGEDIPLYGRIVTVADVIDALLSKRPYKEPFSFDRTIKIVGHEKGKHFDPELTDVVLENLDLLRKLVEDK